MQGRLYRLRPLRKAVRVRRCDRGEQYRRYRRREVPGLRQVRGEVPEEDYSGAGVTPETEAAMN